MSGIVGSKLNIRGSGRVAKLGTDGQVLTSAGAGVSAVYEDAAGGGTILSVKSMKFTGTTSESGSAPTQLSDFDMSFAPTTSDGKLYFQACLGSIGCNIGDDPCAFYFYDVTNTTIIGAYGDADGSRLRVSWKHVVPHVGDDGGRSFGCWHEPGSTDSRDYTIFGNANESRTLYINRNHYNTNNAYIDSSRPASTFTITEYAASAVTLT